MENTTNTNYHPSTTKRPVLLLWAVDHHPPPVLLGLAAGMFSDASLIPHHNVLGSSCKTRQYYSCGEK